MDFLSDIFCPNLPKNDDPNLLQTSSKRSKSRDQASSRRAMMASAPVKAFEQEGVSPFQVPVTGLNPTVVIAFS